MCPLATSVATHRNKPINKHIFIPGTFFGGRVTLETDDYLNNYKYVWRENHKKFMKITSFQEDLHLPCLQPEGEGSR